MPGAIGQIGRMIGRQGLSAPASGPPLTVTINGVTYTRLIGSNGGYLMSADQRPIYGRAA